MHTQPPGVLSPESIRALKQRNELVRECEQLLRVIARRPGYLKLLILVRDALKLYAGYKQRSTSPPFSPRTSNNP